MRHESSFSVSYDFIYNLEVLLGEMKSGTRVKVIGMKLPTRKTCGNDLTFNDLAECKGKVVKAEVAFRPIFISELGIVNWQVQIVTGKKGNSSGVSKAFLKLMFEGLLPVDVVPIVWDYWGSFRYCFLDEELFCDRIRKRFWWILRGHGFDPGS